MDFEIFALRLKVTAIHNLVSWELITVYGPTREPTRTNFVAWLYGLEFQQDDLCLMVGDFNFYRSTSNRNKSGANINDMFIFNDIIQELGLLELPLKGRNYTWSNMQEQPLLQQLDWFFTTPTWSLTYPNTVVLPLVKSVSDHTPCKIRIDSKVPKATLFRYNNYWAQLPRFFDTVATAWFSNSCSSSNTRNISIKLKTVRAALKKWQSNQSSITILIKHCNLVISLLDDLEEYRPLFLQEQNFRTIIQSQLQKLLGYQHSYWTQRYTEKLVTLGDGNTKFFHARATRTKILFQCYFTNNSF